MPSLSLKSLDFRTHTPAFPYPRAAVSTRHPCNSFPSLLTISASFPYFRSLTCTVPAARRPPPAVCRPPSVLRSMSFPLSLADGILFPIPPLQPLSVHYTHQHTRALQAAHARRQSSAHSDFLLLIHLSTGPLCLASQHPSLRLECSSTRSRRVSLPQA